MKDISIYFKPISDISDAIGDLIIDSHIHNENGFPELKGPGIAIVYVPENRRSESGLSGSNESFREEFYTFSRGDKWNFSIYDLGTIAPGESVEDTCFALSQVVSELVKANVTPVIIGGSQDLIVSSYKGFESLEQMINICSVDSSLDVGEPSDELKSNGYVSHLLMQRPCYLFNYANIGMQRLMVPAREVDLFDKLFFDICRLGAFNSDFRIAEPYLRNSDLLSVDFKSIKNGDSDSLRYKNTNGFKSDQICQIMKYAGMSDKMSCVNILGVDPKQSRPASNLLAQMIWYFADGMAQRVGDFPIGNKLNYKKFHVGLEDFEEDLVFYKSDKSARWWLEVSYPTGEGLKYDRHHLVPCNQSDYDNALKNKIPNLWWKTLQKLT
ncbi:arginase family protein [Crocinitomicaceae bacterium]|nr:arginase family protein [Crocinitomicaceae bacterium]MDC0100343.1 arginase family protein [Crocinitomicaceae bacterium]MDC1196262.1 arginase family protein [Crocinitomicaceae bacterium]MDC1282966.1 arginase family protein [Crocinitomicaceae bacterium]|tara:strand:- start:4974 stop:6122 length:1149 start_codon:yes stop_codon:yes gene_type:complete